MIAFAVHDAFAASLVDEAPSMTMGTDGEIPSLGDILAQAVARPGQGGRVGGGYGSSLLFPRAFI